MEKKRSRDVVAGRFGKVRGRGRGSFMRSMALTPLVYVTLVVVGCGEVTVIRDADPGGDADGAGGGASSTGGAPTPGDGGSGGLVGIGGAGGQSSGGAGGSVDPLPRCTAVIDTDFSGVADDWPQPWVADDGQLAWVDADGKLAGFVGSSAGITAEIDVANAFDLRIRFVFAALTDQSLSVVFDASADGPVGLGLERWHDHLEQQTYVGGSLFDGASVSQFFGSGSVPALPPYGQVEPWTLDISVRPDMGATQLDVLLSSATGTTQRQSAGLSSWDGSVASLMLAARPFDSNCPAGAPEACGDVSAPITVFEVSLCEYLNGTPVP